MKVTHCTSGVPLASHLRLISSVGKTTTRRGDCSVMTGGSITGDRMGTAVVRMACSVVREAGSGAL